MQGGQRATWAAWARAGRVARGLTQEEFADRLQAAGASLGVDGHRVRRWELGAEGPGPANREALRAILGAPPWESAAADASTLGRLQDMKRRRFAALAGLTAVAPWQLAGVIEAVAVESERHAANADALGAGPATLEQLSASVQRLSRAYVTEPAAPLFVEMVGVRDSIYERLRAQRRPIDTVTLHFLAGQLCGLLAVASLDLGQRDAAAKQARSALDYAEAINDDGLRAWGRSVQSLVAYWSGRPTEAAELARAGQAHATGAALARLYGLEARALARLRRAGEAKQASSEARHVIPDDNDGYGELGFTPAKLAYYLADASADMGDYAAAAESANQAITLYQTGPAGERSYGCEAGAYIALACAHINRGDVDGACAILGPVLALSAGLHLAPYRERIGHVRGLLAAPRARSAAKGRELMEQIDNFAPPA